MKKFLVAIMLLIMFIPNLVLAEGPINPIRAYWTAPTTNEDGSPATDLAGYKIYIGTVSGIYNFRVIDRSTNLATEYLFIDDTQLPDGQYYIVVTALDTAGHESIYSNEKAFEVNMGKPGPPTNIIIE